MEAETLNLVLVLVGALAGVLLGGGGVFAILSRLNQNPELKDSTEQLLANLVPQKVVDQINDLANRAMDLVPIVSEAIQFVEDVTDGEPNDVQSVG